MRILKLSNLFPLKHPLHLDVARNNFIQRYIYMPTDIKKLCKDCISKCTKCITGCKSAKSPKMKDCIKSCELCIELCKVVCNCLSLGADKKLMTSVQKACKVACKQCKRECGKHAMKCCQECAITCGVCAKGL